MIRQRLKSLKVGLILFICFSQTCLFGQEISVEKTNVNNYLPASSATETVLAKVGDKTITVKEFYERAEFTVRPKYAKGNSEIDKKIILNSLIAEKLIMFERGEKSKINNQGKFRNTITGRKEQVMRQILFHDEGYSKVKIDSAEFAREYKLAGRTYEVEFMNITDKDEAEFIGRQLSADTISFAEVYKELTGDMNVPVHQIPWNSPEFEEVSALLFGQDSVKDNQVFGPVKLPDSYLFFKVTGWIDKPAISGNDQTLRYKNVSDKIRVEKGVEHYAGFIHEVMKGKKIEFDKNTFFKMNDVFSKVYNISTDEIKKRFSNRALDEPNEVDQKFLQVDNDINDLKDMPFFTIDGEVWTVGMFEKERQKHPLVFRGKKNGGSEFPQQFKLAVVDMIRDKYLSDVCYKRGYDKEFISQRITNMWNDALVSFYEQIELLKEKNVNEFFTYEGN